MEHHLFSQRSYRNMRGIHPHLKSLAHWALTASPLDFGITEGLRTKERQKALIKAGVSWTMKSRHLTGHALDFAVWIINEEGKSELTWAWPAYHTVGQVFKAEAKKRGYPIVWGGDWKAMDGPHIELDRNVYPPDEEF